MALILNVSDGSTLRPFLSGVEISRQSLRIGTSHRLQIIIIIVSIQSRSTFTEVSPRFRELIAILLDLEDELAVIRVGFVQG